MPHTAVSLFWLANLTGALHRLTQLYIPAETQSIPTPALYANLSAAMLLGQLLWGSRSVMEALAGPLEGTTVLDNVYDQFDDDHDQQEKDAIEA